MPTEINGYSPSEETALSSLVINEVDSNETFEKMKEKGILQDNQLYLVTDELSSGGVDIPASDTEPATGNYWLDTSAEGGTYYTAGQTLSDTTKTLFGLDATAVPDDALALLSRFHKELGNEYVWEKTRPILLYDTETISNSVITSANPFTAYYGDSFSVTENGFVIDNPQIISISQSSDVSVWETLKGHWVTATEVNSTVQFIPDTATFTYDSSSGLVKVSSFTRGKNIHEGTETTYVNSPDSSAYPPAVSDGYTYTALGQLGTGLRMDLLWENASPTSTFVTQDIMINLSNYDFFMVDFNGNGIGTRANCIGKVVDGGQRYIAIMNPGAGNGWSRRILVYKNKLNISGIYLENAENTGYDDRMVPETIYGIKGVLV